LPNTAVVEVGFNRVVADLAILTFDMVSVPTQTVLVVAPINEANTTHFVSGVNTWASILNAPDTYTLMTAPIIAPFGITTVIGSPVVGFTFGIDSGIKALPTFAVGPNHITALNSSNVVVLPALMQADFFAATVFDTDN
jgi:hypothetical protein